MSGFRHSVNYHLRQTSSTLLHLIYDYLVLILAVPTTPELVKQTSAPVRASLPAAHASQAMITYEQQHVSYDTLS